MLWSNERIGKIIDNLLTEWQRECAKAALVEMRDGYETRISELEGIIDEQRALIEEKRGDIIQRDLRISEMRVALRNATDTIEHCARRLAKGEYE